MPNFGEQPTSTNRDRISKNEEGAEDIKKSLAEATASGDMDKVIELAGQAKAMKGQQEEFINKDVEEAYAEDAERKDQDEAKNEDVERTAAKEIEKVEAERVTKELEEMKVKDGEETAKKIEEVRKQINGGENTKASVNKEQVESEEIKSLRQRFENIESRQAKPEIDLGEGSKPIELASVNMEYLSRNPKEYEEIANKIGTGETLSARFNGESVVKKLLNEGAITEELVIQGIERGSGSRTKDEKFAHYQLKH
jgi:hypothetical protein